MEYPRPLDSYPAEDGLGLSEALLGRIEVEPLNLVATFVFVAAICHTFAASRIAAWADRLEEQHRASGAEPASASGFSTFRIELVHFLGEVEAIFGIWVLPLLAVISLSKGWAVAEAFVSHGVHFTEPLFVVVIMAIASTRPVLQLAEQMIGLVARVAGGGVSAWWVATLTVGPLLGSLITEPAAMVISALLLSRRFFALEPSRKLAYCTLGLLFVNVSVGGTLTHFAAPPVLMVAGRWGWGLSFMLRHFGLAALLGIVVATAVYWFVFRGELAELSRRSPPPAGGEKLVPGWVVFVHCGFLAWTVATAHSPALFIGGFLFFLAFLEASAPHQANLDLRPPLLVGFFLAGLVVHGSLQQWWLEPVLSRLGDLELFFGAIVLTAFNDNAAITYLASQVPDLSASMQVAVVAGAVVGGGLTVIANAPNPAGQTLLQEHFRGGVSPLRLLAGAALPTVVMMSGHLLLR